MSCETIRHYKTPIQKHLQTCMIASGFAVKYVCDNNSRKSLLSKITLKACNLSSKSVLLFTFQILIQLRARGLRSGYSSCKENMNFTPLQVVFGSFGAIQHKLGTICLHPWGHPWKFYTLVRLGWTYFHSLIVFVLFYLLLVLF